MNTDKFTLTGKLSTITSSLIYLFGLPFIFLSFFFILLGLLKLLPPQVMLLLKVLQHLIPVTWLNTT